MSDASTTVNERPVQSCKLNYIDESPLPEWGTGPDGRPTRIDSDARLPGLFREFLADACRHPIKIVVKTRDSLDRAIFFRHCEHCGLKLSSAIAHDKVGNVSHLTAADMENRSEAYTRARKERRDKIVSDAADRAQGGNRDSYADYLRSDAWKRRRDKILKRAGGLCEGCLTNSAHEVHHLTYAHKGNEFAFELVALCPPCHSRLHSELA
jgi:hypothetical protein